MATGLTDSAVWPSVAGLADELVHAWGAWAPMMTAEGDRVAFVSDRSGRPELWVQQVPAPGAQPAEARCIPLGPDPVLAVGWSPDDAWISCSVATGGGVRTEVWVTRPDGSDAQRVAGGDCHAVLGPWAREGHGLVVTLCSDDPAEPHRCVLVNPSTGETEEVAVGGLIHMLDLSADGRFALVRDGTRGAEFCRFVDRHADADHPVLPYEHIGSTDVGMLRPPLDPRSGEAPAQLTAYLVTDAGAARRELVAIGIYDDGARAKAGTIAAREDAELEFADADAAGERVLCVWNVAGRSEVEFVETATGARRPCPGLPGSVVSSCVLARDAGCAVLAVESPTAPRRLWRLDCATLEWSPVTVSSLAPRDDLVDPELVHYEAHDGLPLTAWLYRSVRGEDGPAMISLHGGPEAQERPVFTPQHQVLVAAGITVLAPNIRGSSGFGHAFVHADDRWGRFDAIRDVADSARLLVQRRWCDPSRIAVTGRSYGGYATLMALVRHAPSFAAGVDICGMSDLLTFYRDTEPWIAAAATTKYGDPVRDAALLAEVSPLHAADAITVPLLVVHGELDTNVPLNEARQIVARLRELGRPVEYLELAGEGHEYRRVDSRLRLLQALAEFLGRVLRAG